MTSWQDIVAEKRKTRDAKFPPEWLIPEEELPGSEVTNVLDFPNTCGKLTERELEVTTKYDAVDIVEKITWRKFSVEEVQLHFAREPPLRIKCRSLQVNCLTEILFDDAIERAQELDKQLAANPDQSLPPLFGLPVSIKDSIPIKGYDASSGFVFLCNKPAEENCVLVDWLLEQGAIVYCKTNLPQTQMIADSDNNIWGRTVNPNNRKLTAGGSTGGEGALLAMKGSVLGIGTDIAGSIRIPCLANGIYGFKPTAEIFPGGGTLPAEKLGLPGVAVSLGPMATSARSCQYLMKVVMSSNMVDRDWTVSNVTWQNSGLPQGRPLRVGYMDDDFIMTPTPPVRRALAESLEKLKAAGVNVFPITIEGYADKLSHIHDWYSLDGSEEILDFLKKSGEPQVPSVAMTKLLEVPAKDMPAFVKLSMTRAAFREQVHKVYMDNKLDCLIMPGAPHTAPPHDTWTSVAYTATWNYLNYPAAIIPVGRVQETDAMDEAAKYGEADKKVYSLYTGPEDYKDAPTAVQIITTFQNDERLADLYVKLDSIINS
ncbi:hypothetical protein KEM54_000001 [Ascosphaera aggregata]|nr:hypothetical protein KEM54_000001 [Ascosphaera aggregata]